MESETQGEPLGSKVRRMRLEKGLGQERLALLAHIDQSGLSKFERGKETNMGEIPLRRIAAVLRMPFEELVVGTDYQVK
jgi:transcriptional regulator with XRE-family HTH domain